MFKDKDIIYYIQIYAVQCRGNETQSSQFRCNFILLLVSIWWRVWPAVLLLLYIYYILLWSWVFITTVMSEVTDFSKRPFPLQELSPETKNLLGTQNLHLDRRNQVLIKCPCSVSIERRKWVKERNENLADDSFMSFKHFVKCLVVCFLFISH